METKIYQELSILIDALNSKTQEAINLGLKVEILIPSSFTTEQSITLKVYKPIAL